MREENEGKEKKREEKRGRSRYLKKRDEEGVSLCRDAIVDEKMMKGGHTQSPMCQWGNHYGHTTHSAYSDHSQSASHHMSMSLG